MPNVLHIDPSVWHLRYETPFFRCECL